MSGIPYTRRWLRTPAGLAEAWRQPSPPNPAGNWAADSARADVGAASGALSCRRIVPVPFAVCAAALDSWELTVPGGELRFGPNVLRGPAEHDRRLGTYRIEVRLARGPLRPPLRMRLDIDHWSATSSALELIPGRHVRRSAAYFRAAHRLLDSFIHALPDCGPAQQYLGRDAAGRPSADEDGFNGRGHTAAHAA
jgi:hypothetical protein